MFRLDAKTAVVTGSGSGIGRSIALLFARQGARVTCLDINETAARETATQIVKAGGRADGLACDVSDAGSVQGAFSLAVQNMGGLHILVNNAGIAHVGTIETTGEADFDRLYAVNVKGAFLCSKASIAHLLVAPGGGVILNMASLAALVGVPDRFAYSMTKGAILAMTYALAVDYMKKNIRCNCICPARIHTPFVDGFIAKNYPGHEAAMFKKLSEYQPLGRMGTPDEVAAMALYLCSDEAAFITGQAFPLDGGVLVT